jgi:hypothetical protein
MTDVKDKSFLDWLFGFNGPPEAELALHLSAAHLRIEELQREIDQERIGRQEELEARRVAIAAVEVRLGECQTDLVRANRERAADKASREEAQAEVARLTRAAAEARATSIRDAELRRKVNGRCSSLELELGKLATLLETQSKRERDLEQALNHERAAREDAEATIASQRVDVFRSEERMRDLEQTAARAKAELAELQALVRAERKAQQVGLEQCQKELSLARDDVDRLRSETKRQKASFEESNARQQGELEAERRAWAGWLARVWSALRSTLGPAAPLALEIAIGKLEPVAHVTTTEAAEARLREFLSARSLCKDLSIQDQNGELRLELEPGPVLEGTASGWLAVLATRYLAAMLERPLRTRVVERAGTRLVVAAVGPDHGRVSADSDPGEGRALVGNGGSGLRIGGVSSPFAAEPVEQLRAELGLDAATTTA